MQAAHPFSPAELLRAVEGRLVLSGLRWTDYEALLRARDRLGWHTPRISYLDGGIELMPTSTEHEVVKKTIARLVEAYAEEADLPLNGAGNTTLKRKLLQAGAEPDECYSLGSLRPMPALAIEVVWTGGGVDKLEIYRRIGVREVWIWKNGKLDVHVLRRDRWVRGTRSQLLPDLDLELLVSFIDVEDQTRAVKRWRAALRRQY